jgi:hypothetical protein
MALARRDLVATGVAAVVVLVYVANVQHWGYGYLGSNRWAAVTMLAIGAVGCSVGARMQDGWAAPMVVLGVLGVTSLALAIVALITASQWALLALAIVEVALWLGATLRHAFTPPRPVAVP